MAAPADATNLIFPEVSAAGETVGGTHPTAGLPGFRARDFFAPAGTPAVAPETGTILRLSGQPTTVAPRGAGKAFGMSEYLQGASGTTYFITHLGSTSVKPGQVVTAGQQLGTVADFTQYGTPSHLHIGTSGPIGADQLAQATKVGFPQPANLPDALNYTKNHPYSGGELAAGNATDALSVDSLAGATGGLVQGGTKGIGGGVVSGAVDAAKSTYQAFTSAGSFFAWLGKGSNWQRIGEVIGGAVLMLLGLVMVTKGTDAMSAAGAVAGRFS